jgi:soluble lytic murein transglycosylase-like protein
MQLMPRTAEQMGVTDSFDPAQNIMGGSRYLRLMLNRFNGNITLAVAAYNCGPERVARVMRVPDIAETRVYVRTVAENLKIMAPLFPGYQR